MQLSGITLKYAGITEGQRETSASLWRIPDMARSLLREVAEPAVFAPEVAKQHDVFVRAIAIGELVSARASF